MNSGSVPEPILSIRRLEKRYASGLQALKGVDLEIRRGEIFALLGPNGDRLETVRRRHGVGVKRRFL